jgi:thioredoxin 1
LLEFVTKTELEKSIADNKKVVVKFGASWCSGCKAIAPYLNKIQADNPDVVFVEVNSDDEIDLVTQYNIKNLPTLIGFSNGSKVETLTGSGMSMKTLKDFVSKV